MRSVSPRGLVNFEVTRTPSAAWQRTREAIPGSTIWLAALVLLLVLTIAKSTVAAAWVSGTEVAPLVGLAGAVLMGVLAVTPLPWWSCVGLGFALGPVVAVITAGPALRTYHGLYPNGWAAFQYWMARVADGSAFVDSIFVMFIITWLMWVTGGWLSWCVLRWRQPLIGLVPGAAAFATNVLNTTDQNGYALSFLVLTLALLLWSNYTESIAKAARSSLKLMGDARWDFWESGLVATAALIVLGILMPPLSTVDRTATMESSLFTGWAQLQQQLNRPGSQGTTGNGPGTTGFSTKVSLGGPLKKSRNIVFTYSITGSYVGPRYFRGVNITDTADGEWSFGGTIDLSTRLNKGDIPNYAEQYQQETFATFTVNMVSPPGQNSDILFYPGEFYRVDRDTLASQVHAPPALNFNPQFQTIDKLSSLSPPRSTGTYNITVEYPDVTEAQLNAATTDYPLWLLPYMSLPTDSYRPTDVLQGIHDLATEVTKGATTPYEKATAIQNYLRGPTFQYTLTPTAVPHGIDPMDNFLFNSHQGYCEYFASAMGDMLRALGIPTRLVNGFGSGTFNPTTDRYEVRGEDAHTWVESYFPGYGWVPFEPTPDGTYFPAPRGVTGPNLCLSDSSCDVPPASIAGGGSAPAPNLGRGVANGENGGIPLGPTGLRISLPDAITMTRLVAVVVAILLLLAAILARYLRPRTVMGVWKRTLVLARLAGAQLQPGDTPLELGGRLARAFPEAESPLRALAGGFVVAAYAPPSLATASRASIMEAWASLRPMMLRRVAGRFRPIRS